MSKFVRILCLAGMLVLLATGVTLAAEGEPGAVNNLLAPAIAVTCGLAISIATVGGGLAQGKAIAAAMKGIARNPGAAGKITTPLIIGLAMIESLVIYSLVISLILVFKL